MFFKDRGIDFSVNNNYYIKIKEEKYIYNHGKGNALCGDLCNNQIIVRKQFHEIKTFKCHARRL